MTLQVNSLSAHINDLWAICPTAHSTLYQVIRTSSINITLITSSSIQNHDRYQQHLDNIKRYRMKLILEMPYNNDKSPSNNTAKNFLRWMTFASAASEVYFIGPKPIRTGSTGIPILQSMDIIVLYITGVVLASRISTLDALQSGTPAFRLFDDFHRTRACAEILTFTIFEWSGDLMKHNEEKVHLTIRLCKIGPVQL